MSLILPSLDAFKAMSQPQRAALFVAWCSTQPPEQPTHYWSHAECPLSRFGQALSGIPKVHADGHGFIVGVDLSDLQAYRPMIYRSEQHPDHIPVLTGKGGIRGNPGIKQAGALQAAQTYGELVERLTAVMAAETAPQGEGQPS